MKTQKRGKGGFMRKKTLLNLAVLSAMALVAVAPAFAQDRLEAKIPFAFKVGSKTLPSGDYEVRKVYVNTLVIQNAATHEAAMSITSADSPKEISGEGVLVFHKYGDTCFLSALQAGNSRRTIGTSKLEREVAAKSAETAENTPPREVYVAANTR
jgi:hypothetical protein